MLVYPSLFMNQSTQKLLMTNNNTEENAFLIRILIALLKVATTGFEWYCYKIKYQSGVKSVKCKSKIHSEKVI